jgi:hypothetical protein
MMPGATEFTVMPRGPSSLARLEAFLRDLRNDNLAVFEARLRAAQRAGELPEAASPRALAAYFGAVIQGMSHRARDGATAAELSETAELALRAWPAGRDR